MATDLSRIVEKARRNLARGKSPLQGLTPAEIRAAQAQFSEFVDKRDSEGFLSASVHRVRTIETPRPYIHLMSSLHGRGRGVFGSFWDQTGRGFCCLDSVLAGPITSHNDTSYVPTCPAEPDARLFYLREAGPRGKYGDAAGRKADVWFVIPQNGREEGAYRNFRCDQGAGEIEIAAESRGIVASVHAFVTADDPVEIWTITLKNLSPKKRTLTLFTRVNWSLRSYPAYYFDMRCVCSGIFERRANAVAAFNNDQNNRLPRSGLLMSDAPIRGFDLSREAFDGSGMYRQFPQAVLNGACTGSLGKAAYAGMIAAIEQAITLPPRGEAVIHTLIAAATPEPQTAAGQRMEWKKKYLAPGRPEAALTKVRRTWAERCAANLIATGDDEVDRFFNVWSKYQAGNQARFTRALDMVGYRDVLQDLMGICDFDPAYVRQELLTALSFQLPDGRGIRQYCKFERARHDVRMYMDSSTWISDTLDNYVRETGDFSILDEKVGFFDLEKQVRKDDAKKTVYEHALLSIRSCFDQRGQKGLCLVGHGDWNDALDGIGRGGRGVSVWLSIAIVHAAGILKSLAQRIGKSQDAAWLQNVCDTMTQAVNDAAWDGTYYVHGFDDKGMAIGSDRNAEGKVHLNVNAWALFTGVAAAGGPGRVEAVLKAIATLDTPFGHMLLAPPYTHKSRAVVGRIADMLPGLFENGSIYTHGQSFVFSAMLANGKADQAWRVMKAVQPSSTLPAVSTLAPHQISNFTVGPDSKDFGKNYYSNFSGSINWFRKNIMLMCGVTADYNGLRIAPCVPPRLKSFRVSKIFRGCRYLVEFDNSAGVSSGVKSITIDGRPIRGNLVPPRPGKECRVNVVMG